MEKDPEKLERQPISEYTAVNTGIALALKATYDTGLARMTKVYYVCGGIRALDGCLGAVSPAGFGFSRYIQVSRRIPG
jgi:hypothetical protein